MRQAQVSRFQTAEYARQSYVYTVEEGTPFEDLLRPEYWAHIAGPRTLRPWDIIEVRPDAGDYFAELLVLDTTRLSARMAVLRHVPLAEALKSSAPTSEEYEVAWKGPHLLFCVIRKSDQAIVAEKQRLKTDAQRWISENAKAFAG